MPTVTTNCETCGESFRRWYAGNRTAPRFCSHACYWHSMKGRRKPNIPYRVVRAADHPIAPPSGMLPEYRLVLYDAIGPGPHPCHWCGTLLDWHPGEAHPDKVHVDHLDHDPTNNELENLTVACGACNAHRTRTGERARIRDDEPHLVLSDGARVRALSRTCEACHKPFLARTADVRLGKGRFCSRSCARRGPRKPRERRHLMTPP